MPLFDVAGSRFAQALENAADEFGIHSDDQVAMFLAQLAHESGGFHHVEENLNYSAQRLMQVFPHKFNESLAEACAHQPEKIANAIYGGRMGNTHEGDGYRYRGRGLIQLTGHDNYAACGHAIGFDLLGDPDLLASDPTIMARAAAWFWAAHGCNELADDGDFEGVTRRINGGLNGLEDRQKWLEKIQAMADGD